MRKEDNFSENMDILEDFIRRHMLDPSRVRAYVKQMLTFGPRCDTVPNANGEFGYDKSNPIPVRLPDGEAEYLQSLHCECGEPFDFSRIGSFGPGPDGHVVDGFELVCKAGKHRIELFMDMYHHGPSTLVPKRLTKANG